MLDTENEKARSLAVCKKPICCIDSKVFHQRLKISYMLRKTVLQVSGTVPSSNFQLSGVRCYLQQEHQET